MSDVDATAFDDDASPNQPAPEAQADVAGEANQQKSDEATAASPINLQQELNQANDRLLRSQAELENYRKRAQREMEEQRRYAALPLMRDLLSVLDNMHRAIEAAQQSEATGGLLDGVKMVASQIEEVLQSHHCQRIEAVGAPFDPNLHEAVAQQPSDTQPPNTVTRQTRVGYLMHGRVVRPSQVFVSTGPAATAAAETGDRQEENQE